MSESKSECRVDVDVVPPVKKFKQSVLQFLHNTSHYSYCWTLVFSAKAIENLSTVDHVPASTK